MSSLLVYNRVYRPEIQSVMLVFSTGFVFVSCNSCIIPLLLMSRLVEKAEKERAGSTRALSVKLKALEALIESKRRISL
jgi:hypothetical protein